MDVLEIAWSLRDVVPALRYENDLVNLVEAIPFVRGFAQKVFRNGPVYIEIHRDTLHESQAESAVVVGYATMFKENFADDDKVLAVPDHLQYLPQIDTVVDGGAVDIKVKAKKVKARMMRFVLPEDCLFELYEFVIWHDKNCAPELVDLSFGHFETSLPGRLERISDTETKVLFSESGYPIALRSIDWYFHSCALRIKEKEGASFRVFARGQRKRYATKADRAHMKWVVAKFGNVLRTMWCENGLCYFHGEVAIASKLPRATEFDGRSYREWLKSRDLVVGFAYDKSF